MSAFQYHFIDSPDDDDDDDDAGLLGAGEEGGDKATADVDFGVIVGI